MPLYENLGIDPRYIIAGPSTDSIEQPIPAIDHFSSGRAGGLPFDPRTHQAPQGGFANLGQVLFPIGEIAAGYISQLTGVDSQTPFKLIRQQELLKGQQAREAQAVQFQKEQFEFQKQRAAEEQQLRADQEKRQKFSSGIRILEQANKLPPGPLKDHFLKQGMAVSGLDLGDDLLKAFQKSDDEQRGIVVEALKTAATQAGLDAEKISQVAKYDPELAVELIGKLTEAAKARSEQDIQRSLGEIRSGTYTGQSPTGQSSVNQTVPTQSSSPQQKTSFKGLNEEQSLIAGKIIQTAQRYGLGPEDTRALLGIAAQETRFANIDNNRKDPRDGVGVFQFIPSTAKRYGLTVLSRDKNGNVDPADDRLNIDKNIDAGVRLFIDNKKAKGSVQGAIFAHNGGKDYVANVEKQLRTFVDPFLQNSSQKTVNLAGLDSQGKVASRPETQQVTADKVSALETFITDLQGKRDQVAALPGNTKAQVQELKRYDDRIKEATARLDRLHKESDRLQKQDESVGTQDFRAFVSPFLEKGQTFQSLPRETQQRLYNEYQTKQQEKAIGVAKAQQQSGAEIAASRLSPERRRNLELGAIAQGYELPIDDQEAIAFAKEKKIRPREPLEASQLKELAERTTTFNKLQQILNSLGTAKQGPIVGEIQKVFDEYGINTQGVEQRAAYRALLAEVRNRIISQLSGTAVGVQEAKRLAEELASVGDNLEVARGKIRVGLTSLADAQRVSVKALRASSRFVPQDFDLPELTFKDLSQRSSPNTPRITPDEAAEKRRQLFGR